MSSLADRAARQHGLVSRAQALAALGEGALRSRVRRGFLQRVHRNVYRFAGSPATWRQQVHAAVLAGGHGAVASHWTAAELHGLDVRRSPIVHLTWPTSSGRRRVGGTRAHESERLQGRHLATCDGIPVTSVARTLCDLTWPASPRFVERLVDEALVKGLVTLAELRAVFSDLATRGRRRSTVMRAILDSRSEGHTARGESPREASLAALIRRSGLPPPRQQVAVQVRGHRFRLDLAYPEQKIAIEYDGWAAHRSRRAFDRDRWRQNLLVTDGWTVLRYTSASTPQDVCRTIRELLGRVGGLTRARAPAPAVER